MSVEVVCPACGAIIEAPDRDELVVRAREHTLDAHAYNIPTHHVLADAYEVDQEGAT
jgi:hypothetical protein